MTKEQTFKAIESISGPMSEALKSAWTEKSTVRLVKKGEVLVHEGERSTDLWFVAHGTIRAFYFKDGKQICDWFGFKGDFICAITSYYQDKPSLHQVDMLSDGVLLSTSRENIETLCDQFHEFERLGRMSATSTMIALQEKIVSIQFETSQKRLENLLEVRPDIYQLVPLGDIASYLGMTQETLSRIRAAHARI